MAAITWKNMPTTVGNANYNGAFSNMRAAVEDVNKIPEIYKKELDRQTQENTGMILNRISGAQNPEELKQAMALATNEAIDKNYDTQLIDWNKLQQTQGAITNQQREFKHDYGLANQKYKYQLGLAGYKNKLANNTKLATLYQKKQQLLASAQEVPVGSLTKSKYQAELAEVDKSIALLTGATNFNDVVNNKGSNTNTNTEAIKSQKEVDVSDNTANTLNTPSVENTPTFNRMNQQLDNIATENQPNNIKTPVIKNNSNNVVTWVDVSDIFNTDKNPKDIFSTINISPSKKLQEFKQMFIPQQDQTTEAFPLLESAHEDLTPETQILNQNKQAQKDFNSYYVADHTQRNKDNLNAPASSIIKDVFSKSLSSTGVDAPKFTKNLEQAWQNSKQKEENIAKSLKSLSPGSPEYNVAQKDLVKTAQNTAQLGQYKAKLQDLDSNQQSLALKAMYATQGKDKGQYINKSFEALGIKQGIQESTKDLSESDAVSATDNVVNTLQEMVTETSKNPDIYKQLDNPEAKKEAKESLTSWNGISDKQADLLLDELGQYGIPPKYAAKIAKAFMDNNVLYTSDNNFKSMMDIFRNPKFKKTLDSVKDINHNVDSYSISPANFNHALNVTAKNPNMPLSQIEDSLNSDISVTKDWNTYALNKKIFTPKQLKVGEDQEKIITKSANIVSTKLNQLNSKVQSMSSLVTDNGNLTTAEKLMNEAILKDKNSPIDSILQNYDKFMETSAAKIIFNKNSAVNKLYAQGRPIPPKIKEILDNPEVLQKYQNLKKQIEKLRKERAKYRK